LNRSHRVLNVNRELRQHFKHGRTHRPYKYGLLTENVDKEKDISMVSNFLGLNFFYSNNFSRIFNFKNTLYLNELDRYADLGTDFPYKNDDELFDYMDQDEYDEDIRDYDLDADELYEYEELSKDHNVAFDNIVSDVIDEPQHVDYNTNFPYQQFELLTHLKSDGNLFKDLDMIKTYDYAPFMVNVIAEGDRGVYYNKNRMWPVKLFNAPQSYLYHPEGGTINYSFFDGLDMLQDI